MFRFNDFASKLSRITSIPNPYELTYPYGNEVFKDYDHPEARCFYCGCLTHKKVTGKGTNPYQMRTMDHTTPRCLKGKGVHVPKVVACMKCNSYKGDFTLEQFRLFVAMMMGKRMEDIRFPGELS